MAKREQLLDGQATSLSPEPRGDEEEKRLRELLERQYGAVSCFLSQLLDGELYERETCIETESRPYGFKITFVKGGERLLQFSAHEASFAEVKAMRDRRGRALREDELYQIVRDVVLQEDMEAVHWVGPELGEVADFLRTIVSKRRRRRIQRGTFSLKRKKLPGVLLKGRGQSLVIYQRNPAQEAGWESLAWRVIDNCQFQKEPTRPKNKG